MSGTDVAKALACNWSAVVARVGEILPDERVDRESDESVNHEDAGYGLALFPREGL